MNENCKKCMEVYDGDLLELYVNVCRYCPCLDQIEFENQDED